MAITCVALAKYNLTGSQANVDFTAISSSYDDLLCIVSARGSNSQTYSYVYAQINNNTGSIYTDLFLSGDTSTVTSNSDQPATTSASIGLVSGASATANSFGSLEIYIPNYRSSINKIMYAYSLNPTNAVATTAYPYTRIWAARMQDNNPITSLKLTSQANFLTNSTFDLYGIKKA